VVSVAVLAIKYAHLSYVTADDFIDCTKVTTLALCMFVLKSGSNKSLKLHHIQLKKT